MVGKVIVHCDLAEIQLFTLAPNSWGSEIENMNEKIWFLNGDICQVAPTEGIFGVARSCTKKLSNGAVCNSVGVVILSQLASVMDGRTLVSDYFNRDMLPSAVIDYKL